MALSASIDDLKATIGRRGGVARSNRYVVYFNHPANRGAGILGQFIPTTGQEIIGTIGSIAQTTLSGGNVSLGAFISDPRDLSMLCESTAIPGRSITTPIQSITLRNAYPMGISQVELSNTNENSPSRVTVQMAYDYYDNGGFVEGLTSGGAAGFASRLRGLLS